MDFCFRNDTGGPKKKKKQHLRVFEKFANKIKQICVRDKSNQWKKLTENKQIGL